MVKSLPAALGRKLTVRACAVLCLLFPSAASLAACAKTTVPQAERIHPPKRLPDVGSVTRIEGIAQNAKLSAAVVNDERVVYCLDRTRWSTGVEGKPIIVEGVLGQTDDFKSSVSANGEIGQGTEGGELVIQECRGWVGGPPIQPTHELLHWLERNVKGADGKRRRLRLPVVVSLGEPYPLGLGRACVGISLESSNEIALTLDDSALGISLLERVRTLCVDNGVSCALWLEGYWGPLLERPPGAIGGAEQHTFAVLTVLAAIDGASGADINVLVEIP